MKNKLLLSGIVFALAVLPTISSAESVGASIRVKASTSAEIKLRAQNELEARKKEMEERREELKEEMEERRETIKNAIETKKNIVRDEMQERRERAIESIRERLNNFTEKIVERFEAAIERLEELASRIDSRIAKMEIENIDVKKAKELMAVAKIKIETAKTSALGIGLESQVVASSTATTTAAIKVDFENIKNQIEKAKTDIKAAHAALVDVVANLKPGQNKKATTTVETTSTTDNED